ncbi:MAG: class I mannose-6-phosphate isomerase [Erythrobacter sp.]
MRKLERQFVDKVWGVDHLPEVFGYQGGERIGEVWFAPPPEMGSVLVKWLFASERLSVQAHPSDEQAQQMGLGMAGKSECWIITDAEPGATIAVGFREPQEIGDVRAAALDGSIVDMLEWHEVKSRDAFCIPAGTVHAIGGGVSLIEVQQNTDITFRLYDYGRPRELHLNQGLGIASLLPYPASLRRRLDDGELLVDGPHFKLGAIEWTNGRGVFGFVGPAILAPFSGETKIASQTLLPGECAFVADVQHVDATGQGICLVAQPTAG